MNANQQDASLVGLEIMHRIHAGSGHFRPARHALIRPEPGHTGLHQSHADRFEVFNHHVVTLRFAHLRKAKLKISIRDPGATLHKLLSNAAQSFTHAENYGIRQLYN